MTPIKICRWLHVILPALVLAGCSSAPSNRNVKADTRLRQAIHTPVLARRLDVGIRLFDKPVPKKQKPGEEKKDTGPDYGASPKIKQAETHYIPFHLKRTLDRSNLWGAVRVLPVPSDAVDLTVRGQIIASNGEYLEVHVSAHDALGHRWLDKRYREASGQEAYQGRAPGIKDPYQSLYNTIANDLVRSATSQTTQHLEKIREISRLRFAAGLSPDPYAAYFEVNRDGKVKVLRLPAREDPHLRRIEKIRGEEFALIDLFNEHYTDYYKKMWPDYLEWRKSNRQEVEKWRESKNKAAWREVGGALMLVGGLAIAIAGGDPDLAGITAVAGGHVIHQGTLQRRAGNMHMISIEELADSFGSQMESSTIEIEDKTFELSGTAAQQFNQWRDTLRRIYQEETGNNPAPPHTDSL